MKIQSSQVDYVASNVTADLGNELTPAQAANEPNVRWPVKAGAYYTFCMTGNYPIIYRLEL